MFSQKTIDSDYIIALRKNKKRVYYHQHQSIEFKKSDTLFTGTINTILKDSFLLDTVWHELDDIQMIVDRNGRSFIKSGSINFPIAGITFAFITTINALINGERPVFIREHLIPSASLVMLGVSMWPFINKKYRTHKNWQLITIPS